MRQSVFCKLLSLLLTLAMVLSMVPAVVFAEETTETTTEETTAATTEATEAEEEEETLTVQDILGEKWAVSWNGGAAETTEYLNIVEGGSHGNFALRIGHPTEKTELQLNYNFMKADLGVATATSLALCTKFDVRVDGALDTTNSWIRIIEKNSDGTKNAVSADTEAAFNDQWTTNCFIDVWADGNATGAQIQFAIVLEAGNYFYLDNMRTYGNYSGAGTLRYYNVMQNGSFEQWYGSYNESKIYTQDSDFVRVVDGGNSGDHALQLGSADKATNYTLQLQLNPNKSNNASAAGTYSFDLWAKSEGTVTAADFTMRNGLDGDGNTYSLAFVGTEWTHIEHTEGLTDVAVTTSVLAAELHVELPAGSYFYIDDVYIVKGYSNDLSNLLSDGGFEGVSCLYYFDTTSESTINEVQKKLGSKWSVSWNGGDLASAEYLNIVEGGAHGNYALRIGHPTEATELTLRYAFKKADLNVADTAELAMCTKLNMKLEGTLQDGFWVSITNNVNGATGNNRNNMEDLDLLTSEWSADYFTDVWCGSAYDGARIEFSIVLDAGDYFYVDNIRAYGNYSGAGSMKGINVMQNGSFERWDCTWNAQGEDTDGEFADIIVDPEERSANVLRLGHAEMDTDYTLQLPLAVPASAGYSFDLWAKLEGTATYASFEMYDGSTSGAVRRYSLADVGAEWTHIAHEYDVTDVWVDSSTLLVQIYVNLPAGSYLYLDDINIVRGVDGIYSDAYINRLCDGMFRGYALGFEQPELPIEPTLDTYVGAHKSPAGWYMTWEGEDQYRSNYLTSDAHGGSYALALGGVESQINYTIAHSITLEEGAEYTFEGWFKKYGDFSYISLMNGSTFKSLKNESIPGWTKYTTTFTASSTKNFSIFAVAPAGSQLLADDLVIYKSDDETKTNLLENGDFETTAGSATEQLKVDKAFAELPISVQAQICVPADAQSCGVIFSNYDGKTGYTVGINAEGQPYVTAILSDGAATEGVFTDVDVRTGEELTLLVSNADGQLSCSINGQLIQNLGVAVPAEAELYANAFAIAGDQTYANENYFTGDLISLRVTGAESELAFWNFEGLENPNNMADLTGNGYDALYVGEYFDALPGALMEKYPYSFAVVGDTQYTNRGDTQKGNDYLGGLYQWIVDNQEKYNIQAVLGMGDITDTAASTTSETDYAQAVLEWEHFTQSIEKLNDASIPFTLLRGNHDSVPTTDVDDTLFDTYSKQVGYEAQLDGWYEAGGTLANAYKLITVGQTDWLIIMLDWDHSEDAIAWAAEVIAANPDHKVIVTTHSYQSGKGVLSTSNLMGQGLWDSLLSQYENIELVLCGHSPADPVKITQTEGKNGNMVTAMTIDHQSQDLAAYMTADKIPYAMATLLMFNEDGSQVLVADYATAMGKFYRADGVQTVEMYDIEYAFGEKSDVAEWNVMLGENVGAQFYMNIEEAIAADENAQLKITVADKVTYAAIPEANEAGQYVFRINVAAAQMTDEIKLQLVSGVQAGPEYTYSIRGYADYILDEANGYDDATRNLVTAMLVYGGKAQTYFGYNTDAMADADIIAGASTAVPEDSGLRVQDNLPGIRFYGASLLLQSKTAIRYYFSITDDIAQYTFTDGSGNGLTAKASGQYYYVELGSINPAELDGDFAVTVTKAESAGAISIGYNAVSYMARMYYNENTKQALKDLAQAMYDYHLAAKTYTAA